MAFNLSAELTYTNLVNLIDLAGCPIRAADRSAGDLLIGVGGHCAFNPEPIAAFVDFVVLGDGEEVVGEVTEAVAEWKQAGKPDRSSIWRALAGIAGVYVPGLYEAVYDEDGRLVETIPTDPAAPAQVEKRTLPDLAAASWYP